MNTKVGNLMSTADILSLPSNCAIFFTVGVGGGKSHFCKHQLYEAAVQTDSQILYIINRKNTKIQFQNELYRASKDDRISITTYQAIESILRDGDKYDLSPYKYIVLDEYHHFVADTVIDIYADLVADLALNHSCIRFFLSATPYGADKYMKGKLFDQRIYYTTYIIPTYYPTANLRLFNDRVSMEYFVKKAITENSKAIFFSNNIQMLLNLYHQYRARSMFICSEYNSTYSEYIDEKLKDIMISSSRLPVQFLFTTTCMDIGFNIKDESVKMLVLDLDDIDQIKQCVGRRRVLHPNDSFNIYVKSLYPTYMKTRIRSWESLISKVKCLIDGNTEDFFNRYHRDRNFCTGKDFIYFDFDINGNCQLKPLYCNYLYYLHRTQLYQSIIDSGIGYFEYLVREFQCQKGESITSVVKSNFRYDYLQSIQGNVLVGSKNKSEIYNTLKYYSDSKHLIKNIDGLNEALKKDNLPFKIEPVPIYKKETRKKLVGWKVLPLT